LSLEISYLTHAVRILLFVSLNNFTMYHCGLVVRVPGYRSRGPGYDSRALQKKVVGLERGPLSLVSATEELLDRKVAAPD
jgi:hypothetical protein